MSATSSDPLSPDAVYDSTTAPTATKDIRNDSKHHYNVLSNEGGHAKIRDHQPLEKGPSTHETEKKHGQGGANWGDPKYDNPEAIENVPLAPGEEQLIPTGDKEEQAAQESARVSSDDSQLQTLDQYEKAHGKI